MMTAMNAINQVSYLRTSREFPQDMPRLVRELDKSYIEIAQAVNTRIDGLFPTVKTAITGESWFIRQNMRQQSIRQVFTFTATSNFNHNITGVAAGNFIRCFGSYTDGTKNYGFIFGNTGTSIAGQIVFDVTPTQVEFAVGAGAPTFVSGIIVLEWLSQV